jgi:DNA-binding PucR family transcriptional regulator
MPLEGSGCLLVPDPAGPGRRDALQRGSRRTVLALGPAVEPTRLAESWALARAMLRASAAGALSASGLLRADDHLAELLLSENVALTSRIAARRLAPLEGLTEKASQRMRETALAHVRHNGNAVAMAAELHVHPQTARYRIARLRELFGEDLDDPDARFELEIALRAGR